jgi:hypothetical protein
MRRVRVFLSGNRNDLRPGARVKDPYLGDRSQWVRPRPL